MVFKQTGTKKPRAVFVCVSAASFALILTVTDYKIRFQICSYLISSSLCSYTSTPCPPVKAQTQSAQHLYNHVGI